MNIVLFTKSPFYHENSDDVQDPRAKYTLGLANALCENGHEVCVIAIQNKPVDEQPLSYQYGPIDVLLMPNVSDNYHRASLIHEMLLPLKPDIVQADCDCSPLIVEQLVGGTPTVVRYAKDFVDSVSCSSYDFDSEICQGLSPIDYFPIRKKELAWSAFTAEILTMQHADCVIAASQKLAKKVQQHGKSAYAMPEGVYSVDEKREHKDEKFVLISLPSLSSSVAGAELIPRLLQNLHPEMGVQIVLSSFNEMKEHKLRDLIKKSHPKVREFLVNPPSKEFENLLDTCSFVLDPSKIGNDNNFAAFSFGKNVVCFNPEPDSWSGPLISMGDWKDPNSYETLQKIVAALSAEPFDRTVLFEHAKQFLWSTLVENYVKIYTETMGSAIARGRTRGI
jgi:hypothetical protein